MEITASQFVRHFGQYQDEAIRGPVVVKSHDRVVGAFLSPGRLCGVRSHATGVAPGLSRRRTSCGGEGGPGCSDVSFRG